MDNEPLRANLSRTLKRIFGSDAQIVDMKADGGDVPHADFVYTTGSNSKGGTAQDLKQALGNKYGELNAVVHPMADDSKNNEFTLIGTLQELNSAARGGHSVRRKAALEHVATGSGQTNVEALLSNKRKGRNVGE